MAIIIAEDLRTGYAQDMVDSLSGGSIELQDASDNVLAIFTLPVPAGTAAAGAMTIDTTPELATVGLAAAGVGTVATKARAKTSVGTIKMSGLTVGTSGTHIIASPSATIVEGEAVTMTSGVLTVGNAGTPA